MRVTEWAGVDPTRQRLVPVERYQHIMILDFSGLTSMQAMRGAS